VISQPNGTVGIGMSHCPDWENAKPAAVVNIEKPILVTLGFICTLLGFFLQFLTIPKSQTRREIVEELRLIRKTRKSIENLADKST
jgi:hypothetical protein